MDEQHKLIRLESNLATNIRSILNRLARALEKSILDGGVVDASEFESDIEETLLSHYSITGIAFANNLNQKLPRKLRLTEEEIEVLESALALWYISQATRQTEIIIATLNNDLTRAKLLGERVGTSSDLEERRKQISTTAKKEFVNVGRSRARWIGQTETGIVSSVAKQSEAEVLSGIKPRISGGDIERPEVRKTWRSLDKARPSHAGASGQTVNIKDPFVVGTDLLMHPRDFSLGAGAKEVMNCRCSAEYNQKDIERIRRKRIQNGAQT